MEIEISNFMCHESLKIRLDNFQIISAENGAGKSAIFHAINWCINGGTNNFIKRGKKESYVSIKIDNDIYKREVVKDKYFVYKNNIEICTTKDSLKDIGVNIPLEYFSQFDKLFLLNESPKNRADLLNSMFDIEKIETASTDLTKEIKDDKKSLENLTIVNEKNVENLQLIEEKLFILSKLKDNYNKEMEKLDKISKLIENNNKIKKVPKTLIHNIDFSVTNKLKSIIDSNLKIKNLPNSINTNIEYSIVKKINDLINVKNKLIKTPYKIDNGLDYATFNKIKEVKLSLDKINANNEEKLKFKNEIIEIENKLKGSVCPCCKKKI
jgi:DNA repair ATPase RecN